MVSSPYPSSTFAAQYGHNALVCPQSSKLVRVDELGAERTPTGRSKNPCSVNFEDRAMELEARMFNESVGDHPDKVDQRLLLDLEDLSDFSKVPTDELK